MIPNGSTIKDYFLNDLFKKNHILNISDLMVIQNSKSITDKKIKFSWKDLGGKSLKSPDF